MNKDEYITITEVRKILYSSFIASSIYVWDGFIRQ